MVSDWENMTIDELFVLREEMAAILGAKLMARKNEIEKRLQQLNPSLEAESEKHRRPQAAASSSLSLRGWPLSVDLLP